MIDFSNALNAGELWMIVISDREAVTELDAKLKSERKQAGEKVCILQCLFLTNTDKLLM